MLGCEWFLINTESDTTQERRGSSEIGKGVLSLVRRDLVNRQEDRPCGGCDLGTLFTSLGLSLVIHKMGPMTRVPSGPGWWCRLNEAMDMESSALQDQVPGLDGWIPSLVHQPRKIQLDPDTAQDRRSNRHFLD